VGAVQKLATVVIIGLVALATVLVLYLADENNRIKAEEREQQDAAIERATANFISLCLPCHGPAGEGYLGPGEAGTGRVGAALGGINTSLNQEGVYANGTAYPGSVDARATVISQTIHNGLTIPGRTPVAYRMPAWSEDNGGPLNDSQIEELVVMIQHVDWNRVYNEAVATYAGYPTAPPATPVATTTATATPSTTTTTTGEGVTINLVDIAFNPSEVKIPAGTDVTITLVNQGAAPHNFSITDHNNPNVPNLNVSVDVNPGETKTVTVNASAGTYYFFCNVPGHEAIGMFGTLNAQ
jgi:plastocyanin